jgi:hypothetical protein
VTAHLVFANEPVTFKHVGRTPGKDYETVVNAYRKGNVLQIRRRSPRTPVCGIRVLAESITLIRLFSPPLAATRT